MDFCQWTPCGDLKPSTSGSYLCETFVDKWLQEVLVALNDAKLKTVAKWCKPCASKSISRKKSYYLLIFYQGFLPHLLVGSFTKPIWRCRPETAEPEGKKQGARKKARLCYTLDGFGRIFPASPVTGFPDHYRVWEMSTIQPSLVDLQGAQPYDDKVDMPWPHGISRSQNSDFFVSSQSCFFLNFVEFWLLDWYGLIRGAR